MNYTRRIWHNSWNPFLLFTLGISIGMALTGGLCFWSAL